MASLDFIDGMYFVHPTMPGQATLAALLGNACGFARSDLHDVSEMFLVSLYTFVGWYIMSSLLRLAVAPKAKDKCPIDLVSDDEPEEVKYEEESLLECDRISSDIAPVEHQSSVKVPLEQYGAFGEESASWTPLCVERSRPKCDVAKRSLGMALLEQYGVFGATPGAWCEPCPIDLDEHQKVLDDARDDAIEDALEEAIENAIERVKDVEQCLLECDQIPSDIASGECQSSGMVPLEKSLDDWEDVLNDALNDAIEDAFEKAVENAIEQVKDEEELLSECNQILSDIVAEKHQSSGMVPLEKSLDDWENVLNDMIDDGLDHAFEKLLEDALEQAQDDQNCLLECYHDQISSDSVPAKCLRSDLVPLEHYGAFGAGAMPRVERQKPKRDNLGMALLEHYGVFDAAPGAWD